MGRFLILDIGAGTMDILWYDTASHLHYKAVAKSPVLCAAEKAASLPGDLLVLGTEMGGGSVGEALRKRAQNGSVVMSRSASATVHHNPERVLASGIKVVEDRAAEDLQKDPRYSVLWLGDLDVLRLHQIVECLDVPFAFEAVGICAQDHGVPPPGISHLDYRHGLFRAALDKDPRPHSLLFHAENLPPSFSRLKAISRSAEALPADQIYLMDSGMAAILGASMDPAATGKEIILTLDVATSHTVGATLDRGELAGFFEYHTQDVTLERLEALVVDLAEGNLDHRSILREGGHGAYIRKPVTWDRVEAVVVTGPRRGIVKGSRIPLVLGSPLGDNMMAGTVGVLEAMRRHMGLEVMSYR